MIWIDFDYAVVRFFRSVQRGECINVGVILHAPTAGVLRARFRDDIAAWCEPLPPPRVARYLDALRAVSDGDDDGGPLAMLSRSERFHWLTAPRSDCLQASPRHPGRAIDLDAALDRIFEHEVSHGASDE